MLNKCSSILLIVERKDYICTPSCNITFTTGDTAKEFNITLLNNEKFKHIEHFNMCIVPPDYVSQSNPSEALILLANVDG